MQISNWDTWQSYRSDRGAPPWIKVHRNLMTNADWAVLSDAEKGQLISLWIVAADKGGQLPDDAKVLRKICQLDDAPDIEKFKELGFIEATCNPDDAKVTPKCQPDDAPEESRGEESRVDKKIKKEGKPSPKGSKKLPDDWELTEALIEQTKTKHGWNDERINEEFEDFAAYYRSDNTTRAYKDWNAVWQGHCRRQSKFDRTRTSQKGKGTIDTVRAVAARRGIASGA